MALNAGTQVDRDWMHYFCLVITNFNDVNVKQFQDMVDRILQFALKDLSFASFDLLLQAFTAVMKHEANPSVSETARKIKTHWATFNAYSHHSM